jgi:uroporphyrin-III C-methyltransferase
VTVYLVGAGPGDPDLMTRRAANLLALADVVIVDRLVDPRALDECRREAQIIYVGKRGHHPDESATQESINDLLVLFGSTDATVVRLKGGDPFVFGRGGEEADALREAGIGFEVVPGISSAFGLPALAGIPVTDRRLSSSVTVLSGHDPLDPAIGTAASLGGTIVLLMAVRQRAAIAATLIEHGLAASTPVAVIEHGASANEARRLTSLDQLGSISVESPAVFVVGAVSMLVAEISSSSSIPRPSSRSVST